MLKRKALAKFLDVKERDLDLQEYKHYGLEIYALGDKEYAIGTDKEAQSACGENIRDMVWAFNANFIANHTKVGYSPELEKSIKSIQEQCEGSNAAVTALIDDMDEFIEDAILCDGRGHFLNNYDNREDAEDEYYIYRIN